MLFKYLDIVFVAFIRGARSGDLFFFTGVGTVIINILQFLMSFSLSENFILEFLRIFLEIELLKSIFFFNFSIYQHFYQILQHYNV